MTTTSTSRRSPLWAAMCALAVLATGSACTPADPQGAAPSSSAPSSNSSSSSGTLAATDDLGPTTAPDDDATDPATDPATDTADPATGTALAAVAELTVKGRAPQTGYTREQFGPAWADVDHNGCDTRNDILHRDLTDVVTKDGTHDCVVLSGTFADPYSGQTIAFQRGQDTSGLVQIDHVVALSDAWQKGAQQWDDETRRQFANDPLNLLAADGPLNGQKGAGDTATWLPPNKAFRCAYVARQVGVKRAYGLWVTDAERDAMITVLSTCPQEPLPDDGAVRVEVPAAQPAEVQPTAPEPAEVPADVYFANCTQARAAGAAPLHVGEPGYRAAMDRDGDGVACE